MTSCNDNETSVTELLPNVKYKKEIQIEEKRIPPKLDFTLFKSAVNKIVHKKSNFEQYEFYDISFCNLSYQVNNIFKKDKKCILKNISGEFRAGELTAIMGPSGAGKTSLLDVLAGYITTGISGKIMINGIERNTRHFSKKSCYIMQSEELHGQLSVYESMVVAINLKLGASVKMKQDRIHRILISLGLAELKKTMVVDLSGGQRKRLAIAQELVSNPQIMFFDEPTSGLDSSTSTQCIKVLQNLAQQGKTIICTIHQPSALLLELFDHIVMIASGQCVYSGSTKELVNFLDSQGLKCPPYHNPVDFLMESISECSEYVPKLVNAIEHGSCTNWRGPARRVFTESIITPSIDTPSSPNLFSTSDTKVVQKTDRPYLTSFTRQLCVLLVRNFKKTVRNKVFFHLKVFAHFLLALFIGTLYYDIGNDAHYIFDNYGFLFFSLITMMFFSFSSATITFPFEIKTLKREHFNSWYSLRAFYLGLNISEIPVLLLCTVVFCSVTYLLTSQPLEGTRFSLYCLILVLTALIGQSFGFLVGACMSIQNAFVFGPMIMIPFMAFSGYFVLLSDAPYYTKWLFHISFVKYGFEGVMLSIYQNRQQLTCSSDYCHFKIPDKFMNQVGIENDKYGIDLGVLLFIVFLLRISAYICLKMTVKSRER